MIKAQKKNSIAKPLGAKKGLKEKTLQTEHEKTIKMLLQRDIDLRATAEKLQKKQAENEKTIKMLIQRDIELRKINERIEQMNTEKSEFISIAAHELRTPLTAIKWLAQIIQKEKLGKLNHKQKEQVKKLNQIINKMVHLVGDILNVARIEEGRFGFKIKTLDLGKTLEEVIKISDVLGKAKEISILKNINSNMPPIRADKEKIMLAIGNIIDNAIKYTPKQGSVEINANSNSNNAIITVSDTGIGIPEDAQSRMYTKFFRGNNALKVETEGTGLGLFIARNIIESHGGSIAFTSRKNKGTTFTIQLPMPK